MKISEVLDRIQRIKFMKEAPIEIIGEDRFVIPVKMYKSDGITPVSEDDPLNVGSPSPEVISGVTTPAPPSNFVLVDTTKDFELNSIAGKLVIFEVNGIQYIRKITECLGSALVVAPTQETVPAGVTLGSGNNPEGSVIIRCKGILSGSAGAGVSIILRAGTGKTGLDTASYDAVNKLLTVVCDDNAIGVPRDLWAGNFETLINQDAQLNLIFEVDQTFVAGTLPLSENSIPFGGGIDEIIIPQGTQYTICGDAPVIPVTNALEEQKTQANAVGDVITFNEDINVIDIFHSEALWQQFVVNGITLTVPPGGWRTAIGGTIGKTVEIPNGINCIVGRLE